MASELVIPLQGSSVVIWERCKSFVNDVLQSRFECIAASERSQAVTRTKTPVHAPEKRFETLMSKVKVSVCKADLTNLSVDAVVNAANERLQHFGGLALALSMAGGPRIQHDSDQYVKNNGLVKTGEAVAMDPGCLPCKKIIHTVGPQVTIRSDLSQAAPLLERAVSNSLRKAEECSLNSVALPAISSGLFGYPLPECANSIARTVRYFCEQYPITHLKEILLVNNDDRTVTEMEKACRRVFAVSPASGSAGSKAAKSDHRSTHAVQLGTVRLTLKRGKIEEEKTNVIVNTTGKDCSYNGQISTAILTKAGPKMTEELKRFNVAKGIFIPTKPYNLHCKEVYHTLCTDRSSDKTGQTLSLAVWECLQAAAGHSHQSISFPAIGTGGLNFKKEEVAQIMSDTVVKFANSSSKHMDVYFVIYPSDDSTFKAFEEKIRSLQQKPSNTRLSNAGTEQREGLSGSGASTPKVHLSGPSEESVQEARAWLTGILFASYQTRIVQNNFITHLGEEEYLQLTKIMSKNSVSFEGCLKDGQARIVLKGPDTENVAVSYLEVENLLCKVQREFIKDEEKMLLFYANTNLHFERSKVPHHEARFSTTGFLHVGLEIVKVESVKNATLRLIFDLKKAQLRYRTTRRMLQCIPAHFCNIISHIGFQAELAPPDVPAQGQGIYFTSTVSEAMKMWTPTISEYLYFVEAEVLTGTSVPGTPDLILPPPVGADPLVRYDSVSGGPDISVIFTGYQALPLYIIICKKIHHNDFASF